MDKSFYSSPEYKEKQSLLTKRQWIEGKHNSLIKPEAKRNCFNTSCQKLFLTKPGIRVNIDPYICFYSTWEANITRVLSLVGLAWEYAPRIFDLGKHTYRPDFYLPESDIYIEVKNFMNSYSLERDRLFRQLYPDLKLEIIGQKEYKEIEKDYRELLPEWE